MDRFSYSSLSAMRSAMARQTATANNLANAATPGFRADWSSTEAQWLRGSQLNARAMATEEVRGADMKDGAINATGRPLDVALSKDALLAVQADDGSEAYTRRGDLQMSDTGVLSTGDGTIVLGEGGPITIPPADKISIDKTGMISITPAGGDPDAPMVEVDRLKLVSTTGSKIAKGRDGLFRVEDGGALPSDPEARVVAGSLESSNVNVSTALIDMIEASRAWEQQVKMLTEARDLDTAAADLMRLD